MTGLTTLPSWCSATIEVAVFFSDTCGIFVPAVLMAIRSFRAPKTNLPWSPRKTLATSPLFSRPLPEVRERGEVWADLRLICQLYLVGSDLGWAEHL